MFTYEIVKENKDDAIETVVKKLGITAEFSMKSVYDHKLKLEREIKEKKAEAEVNAASMANIMSNHGVIATIIKDIKTKSNPEGILATLFLYIKHDIERANCERMAKEREELLKEYDDELETIHSTLSIPKPVKISYDKAE